MSLKTKVQYVWVVLVAAVTMMAASPNLSGVGEAGAANQIYIEQVAFATSQNSEMSQLNGECVALGGACDGV